MRKWIGNRVGFNKNRQTVSGGRYKTETGDVRPDLSKTTDRACYPRNHTKNTYSQLFEIYCELHVTRIVNFRLGLKAW